MSISEAQIRELQAQVLQTFRDETNEGLERLERQVLLLNGPVNLGLVDELFRVVHTVKGNAGGVGLRAMAAVAHHMEAYLDLLRGGVAPHPEGVQCLLEGGDALRFLLDAPATESNERYADLCERLERVCQGPTAPVVVEAPVKPASRQKRDSTFCVSLTPNEEMPSIGFDPELLIGQLAMLGPVEVQCDTSRLPSLVDLEPHRLLLSWQVTICLRSDEVTLRSLFDIVGDDYLVEVRAVDVPKVAQASPARAPAAPPAATPAPAKGAGGSASVAKATEQVASVRVGVDKLDAVMNLVGELLILGSALNVSETVDDHPAAAAARRRESLERLARLTRGLHESVLRMRSMPVGSVFNRFPRMVHDISARLGKEIELEIRGETIELDKTVLERLGDPLVHLLRNSLDHGIESPDDREAAGKPRMGRITLTAEQQGNSIVIEVKDDGRGLHCDRILARGRERGLVAADAELTDAEIRRLILAPGFSTMEQVSDLSGRGVGMDVVYTTLRELGGDLQLDSVAGEGTTMTLRLPLTLAIIEGQLLRFGGRTWVVPVSAICECVRLEPASLTLLIGRGAVYDLDGENIPVLDLCAGFGVGDGTSTERLLMVLDARGERVAVLVDELVSRQQIVVKSLESHARRVPGLGGATILGDGGVAFILDAGSLPQACPLVVRRPSETQSAACA